MAHPPEKRGQVRQFYVRGRMDLQSAAEAAGVSYPTARRWKAEAENEGEDWDRARSAARIAADGIRNVMELVLDEFIAVWQVTVSQLKDADAEPLVKAEALARLSDSYNKTVASFARTAPSLNKQAVVAEVLDLLARFIGDRRPEMMGPFAEVLEPFAAFAAKEIGR